MSSTTKLLPCPFCSNADISIKNENPKDNSGGYFIECPGCGASTSLRFACGDDPTYLLAEQWNRRTASHCLHQIQEPATRLQQLIAEIDQHMRAEWNAGRLPTESWPTTLASRVSAAVAGSAATAHTVKPTPHPDDVAVDALNGLMKAKLAKQRDKGYGVWNTEECTQQRLSELLRGHVDKGDPVDVANYCAFLSARGEGITPQAQADAQDAELLQFLQESDQHLLHRFIETTEDDESYDIGKDAVKRLAEIGVLRNHGFGRYSVTMFGYWVHEHFWHQNPSLPLKTNADRDRAAIAAAKLSDGTPAHYLVDEHYPTQASERGAQAAQGSE